MTYGTVPGSAAQTFPLLGQLPQPLEPSADYRLLLIDAAGDTTVDEFTR